MKLLPALKVYLLVECIKIVGSQDGEGKQKLPVKIQESIDQMWQDIISYIKFIHAGYCNYNSNIGITGSE